MMIVSCGSHPATIGLLSRDWKHLAHQREPGAFRTTHWQRNRCTRPVGGRFAFGRDRPAKRNRFFTDTRLAQAAKRPNTRCHIEQERPASVRDGDCNGTGRQARDACTVTRHQWGSGDQNDCRTAAFGCPRCVTPDRSGVGRIAHSTNAHPGRACAFDRNGNRLHHGNGTRGAMCLQYETRGFILDKLGAYALQSASSAAPDSGAAGHAVRADSQMAQSTTSQRSRAADNPLTIVSARQTPTPARTHTVTVTILIVPLYIRALAMIIETGGGGD
jgi:hypothetical protein